jgi:hypothetical protein
MFRTFAHAQVTGEGIASRRGFLKSLAVAGGAGCHCWLAQQSWRWASERFNTAA